MQTRLQRIWLVLAVAILGCDARASEDYRGEPLLSLSGKLLFKNPRVPDGVVPALAFIDGAAEPKWHLLDVDVRGEFPTNFTLDVMSPPPAAAMRSVAGVPSYALALVAAVAADHGPALILPAEYDGAGTFSWCENVDTDCYRTIELCVKGTDNCYRERARCKLVPTENRDATREECDEILEQSGDPEIAFPFNSFAGVSANYVLLYVAAETPAGASRAYLLDQWSAGSVPSGAFGKSAIPSGYHLIQVRPQTAPEQATGDACWGAVEAQSFASFNAKHGTNFTSEDVPDQLPGGLEDPLYKELMALQLDASWAASCGNGLVYIRLDPASAPIELTIGTRDLALIW